MSGQSWERVRTELRSVRSRVLMTTLVFLAVALLTVGGLTHYLRLVDLDESVRQDIVQEAGELQRLAQRGPLGSDASPSEDLDASADEAFTDLTQLFYVFMTTTVPGEHESILALVDGEPAFEHAVRSRFQLDDPSTITAVVERARPGQTVVFDHEQDGRMLRLGVISVVLDEDPRQGYLVVGFDMSAQRQIVLDSLWRYLGTAALTMVVAGVVAFVEQRQFLDDAAHELRTPLTILHGNLELMDEHDPADVEETRAMLLDEIERMNRLVEDLLLLAKAQRADFIRPGTVDIGALLDDAMDRLRSLGDRQWLLESRVEGRCRLEPALGQLHGEVVFSAELRARDVSS